MSRIFCNYVTLKGKHATNCLNMSILLKYIHLKLKAYFVLTAISAINNIKIVLHLHLYNRTSSKGNSNFKFIELLEGRHVAPIYS